MAKTGQAKQIIENRRGDTFDGLIYLAPAVRDFMNVLFSSAEFLLRPQMITSTKRMKTVWHCNGIRQVCENLSAWFVAASYDRDMTKAATARTITRQLAPYLSAREAI